MKIVGCDLHTRYQQIAMLDTEMGELSERRLEHANGEAKAFYSELKVQTPLWLEDRRRGFSPRHWRCFRRRLLSVFIILND